MAGKEPEKTKINVVLVADIDWILRPTFSGFARAGKDPDDPAQIDFKFQNIPFVLNILDSLAGDDRFIDLRKRTRSHRILTKIEEATEEQRKASLDEQTKFFTDARQQIEAAQDEFNKKMSDLENRKDLDPAREGADDGTGANSTGADSRRANRVVRKGSQPRKSSRASASWRPRFAACRIDTSCWPCCCRRSRRSCWRSSCSSTVARRSRKASIRGGCGMAGHTNRRPRERSTATVIQKLQFTTEDTEDTEKRRR